MKIKILTCGGTIDKIYFDAKSEFQVGEPQVGAFLKEAQAGFDFNVHKMIQKDSLDMNDEDRDRIRRAVETAEEDKILITHGTDTMVETAKALKGIPEKTIVLTGALAPARFRETDAIFNIGCAVIAVQCLAEGVYIVMNGRVFLPDRVKKNTKKNCFEDI
ncbi:asparaginase [bacterium]|nr:asparaginase [bacterium]